MTSPPRTDVLRPVAHFTPPAAWLNDPNGLVHLDGEYHVFYQHNPVADVWGPMHWGHGVSRDLVRWDHLPVALEPDEHGTIFSGSAVVDIEDTAGFGAGTLVALFTHHSDQRQCQSLAFSHDRGRTWTKYPGNPVLDRPEAGPDFRDPKVFRYRSGDDRAHWVMVLATGRSVRLYRSDDLLSWTQMSSFGDGQPAALGVFECPDLFPVAVDGGPEQRWVLAVGHLSGGPTGGSGTRYFVGSFDGETFTCDDDPTRLRWADRGADLYATQTWSDVPDGRRLWAGWMNNWLYADRIPSDGWRGALSIPRELGLTRVGAELVLTQRPIAELSSASQPLVVVEDTSVAAATAALSRVRGLHLDVQLDIDVTAAKDVEPVGLAVGVGTHERTTVTVDPARGVVELDRRRSGETSFHPDFAAVHAAPLEVDERVRLRVLFDGRSVEVFTADGRVSLTDLVFPAATSAGIELLAGHHAHVRRLEVSRIG